MSDRPAAELCVHLGKTTRGKHSVPESFEGRQRLVEAVCCRQRSITDIASAAHVPLPKWPVAYMDKHSCAAATTPHSPTKGAAKSVCFAAGFELKVTLTRSTSVL
jgi:hypothetical protein